MFAVFVVVAAVAVFVVFAVSLVFDIMFRVILAPCFVYAYFSCFMCCFGFRY